MKNLLLLLFLLPNLVMAELSLTNEQKIKMLEPLVGKCFQQQKNADVNSVASDDQIRFYCSCFGNEILNVPNFDDIAIGMVNGDLPPTALKNTILLAGRYCAKQSLKRK